MHVPAVARPHDEYVAVIPQDADGLLHPRPVGRTLPDDAVAIGEDDVIGVALLQRDQVVDDVPLPVVRRARPVRVVLGLLVVLGQAELGQDVGVALALHDAAVEIERLVDDAPAPLVDHDDLVEGIAVRRHHVGEVARLVQLVDVLRVAEGGEIDSQLSHSHFPFKITAYSVSNRRSILADTTEPL